MKSLFVLVEITDIWHRFMLHPQFIRYHLFRNMKLFKIFLKYWHSMRAIDIVTKRSFHGFNPFQSGADLFELIRKYLQYLLNKYNDISYCFYSMMKHLKTRHLKKKYLGKYINTIEAKIGGTNVCSDDNYQCLL